MNTQGQPNRSFSQVIRNIGLKISHDFRQLVGDLIALPRTIREHAPFWPRRLKQGLSRDSRQAVRSIRRVGKERVFRLKGYTTIAKVNRKRQAERQQRLLRRLLIIVITFLLVILLFNLYNPIRDLSEWYRVIGVKDLTDMTGVLTESSSDAGGETTEEASASDDTSQETDAETIESAN